MSPHIIPIPRQSRQSQSYSPVSPPVESTFSLSFPLLLFSFSRNLEILKFCKSKSEFFVASPKKQTRKRQPSFSRPCTLFVFRPAWQWLPFFVVAACRKVNSSVLAACFCASAAHFPFWYVSLCSWAHVPKVSSPSLAPWPPLRKDPARHASVHTTHGSTKQQQKKRTRKRHSKRQKAKTRKATQAAPKKLNKKKKAQIARPPSSPTEHPVEHPVVSQLAIVLIAQLFFSLACLSFLLPHLAAFPPAFS